MSKQTNEQDERKSPSGEAQGSERREATGQSGSADDKRTAPSDKSSREGSAAGKTSKAPPGRSGTSRDTPAANPSADKASTGKQNKPTAAARDGKDTSTASKTEGRGDEPQAGKASAQADTSQASQAGAKAGKSQPSKSGSKTDKAEPSRSGGGSGGGKANAAPAAGGGNGGQSKGSKSGALALVLVVVLALAAGFFAQRIWQRIDGQQQRLAELESRADSAATQDALAELETRLEEGESERNAELNAALDELRERFSDYRSEIDGTLDQVLDELSSEQEPDAREWLHAEAAYLLRLANQRLQLERDVEGAIALLETADERLSEADNPALLSVRRSIASEIAILEGVPQVDRSGLYLALNAQQERLAQLPLSRELEEIPARSGIEEAPDGGWQQQLSRFGEELKDLVVVRHHDQALESLISPEQESYLRQSVRLVLEQAQLALLKEEQDLFEASLDKALTLIDGYYATDREEVQAVVERLESLKGETIRPELPDISGSHEALETFIERRFGSRDEQGDDA
ncbi:uroporphyrinogen-III C-methyltransferase [Billgrantia gudaonensis]|uniref:Uroporphyrin-3 C-methyltransferase n=1 Tax=Billgrantia gudaonensis TaxID=376427 RepID=A0A1G8YJF9_9GAMM|nr:uroporphyrinogen-III C-methyltransferase [Halomonas gudaonensis]SDK02335.1 uroporphyrin-3 C-methyltransferase [Halomonas gudaonensis]